MNAPSARSPLRKPGVALAPRVPLRAPAGSVLPLVLLFSAFALVAASVYIGAQFTIGKPALSGPAAFQALCNARSGIYKGLELLSKPQADTLARINTLDSMFNKQLFLFGKQTSVVADGSSGLTPDDTPMVVQPYGSDSFGTAAVSLTQRPCFDVLVSKGEFRNAAATVRAILGGSLYSSFDTVCRLLTGTKPEGGLIAGTVAVIPQQTVVPDSKQAQQVQEFRTGDIARVVYYYRGLLAQKADTSLPANPRTVQTSEQCAEIPEVVNGPLFLSSPMAQIVWKEKRRVFVLGDVQVTGNTVIENVEIVTSGELKCFDQSVLRNVSVFTAKRLVIGDRASFSGNALALSSVLVYKDGRIENQSVIVSYGENKTLAQDTTQRKKPQLPVSVFLRGNALVDGVIVACGTPGGIEADKNTVVHGALWASGAVVLQGSLYGVLRANDLTDMQTLKARTIGQGPPQKNVLEGSIRRLESLPGYAWPFFMGKSMIARWDEG
ncbi:MAG TPA: hypothetical protein VKF42_07665 [Chitinivibrionales bacterium]|jgi:hypothetical protein|nr:hypothetical protein [Chitinivibrionales bacterium]